MPFIWLDTRQGKIIGNHSGVEAEVMVDTQKVIEIHSHYESIWEQRG